MSQKLPAFNFEWIEDISQFTEVFIKSYDEKSEVGYILEADVQLNLFEFHTDLTFLPERKKLGKVEKLGTSLDDKSEYIIHIKTLNHGLILKQVHRVISSNQDEWLKPYVKMNKKLRAEVKNDFQNNFFKLMNNTVFGKTMENLRKHRDIKLITI